MPADETPTPPSGQETTLWKGYSSQWTHFWYYLFCLILTGGVIAASMMTAGLAAIGLVVPFFMWIIRWWLTKSTSYELTTQRLKIDTGILNRRHDELELYRVKDYAMESPLFLRLVGLGNITMLTSDATTPTVTINAIRDAMGVREKLRVAVQSERDRKRVRELDVDGGSETVGA
jgi:uncharacterized membrane protein YdbT with pleckstrin-like domain